MEKYLARITAARLKVVDIEHTTPLHNYAEGAATV